DKKKKKKAAVEDLPDDLWETCPMLQHNRLLSKVKLSLFGAKFTISDWETKDQLGMAKEVVPFWKLGLRGLNVGPIKFRSWMATRIDVRQSDDGPVLCGVRKLASMMSLVSTAEVYDFRNELIGYFKGKIFSLMGGFWLYDANDEQVAEVQSKL